MKHLWVGFGVFILSIVGACAEDKITALIGSVKAAIQSRGEDKIEGLTDFTGMTDSDRTMYRQWQYKLVTDQRQIINIEYLPVHDDFYANSIGFGKKLEATHAVLGVLRITYGGGMGDPTYARIPVTTIDGDYFLAGVKSINLNWHGPVDHRIGYQVIGRASQAQLHARWNVSGVERQATIPISGDYTAVLVGQYMEEVTLTSQADDANLKLVVTDGINIVYTSPELHGQGKLQYVKK